MDKITLGDKSFVPYIDYATISKAIDDVAARINADFKDSAEEPVLLCLLNGAIMFCAEMMKRLDFNCSLVSLKLTSYQGTTSTGVVVASTPVPPSIKGKTVIVIEDIVDTGRTIEKVKEMLKEAGAKDIKICTMLLKPEVFGDQPRPDYVAMEIANRFIVGFGLDYDELGRNIKDIYVLDE